MNVVADLAELPVVHGVSRGRFSPYPSYRTVGLIGVQKVPSHWIVDRLKRSIAACQNGLWGEEPDGLNDLPVVRVADFDRLSFQVASEVPTVRAVEPRQRMGRVLRRGDLLIEKSGGGEKQPVGVVVLYGSDREAICSNFVARMPVAAGYSPRFLCYLHAALYSAGINTRSIKQTTGIQNLDSGSYLDERVAYPPADEQEAIAAFVDRETAKIDELVAKKERLIGLLQEEKEALVTQVISCGLLPDARAVETQHLPHRLVPEHWEVKRLRHVSPEQTVGVVVNPSSYFVDDGVPILLGNNISSGCIHLDGVRFIGEESNRLLAKSMLRTGDLVVVRVGDPGVAAVVPPELDRCNCASMMIVRQSPSFDSRWLCYAFNSKVVRAQVDVVKYGAAQKQFNISHAVNFWLPVPPLNEQREIADSLDAKLAVTERLVAKIRDGVERLREYRSALITAAVTGQIDVRGNAE